MKPLISPFSVAVLTGTLAFAAVAWFMVMGQLEELAHIQAEEDAQQTTIVKTKPGGTAKDQQEKLLRTKETADLLLPTADNQYDLSVQVEALSKTVGVSLSSLVLTQEAKPVAKATPAEDVGTGKTTTATPTPNASSASTGGLKKVIVAITAAGTYEQLQGFVDGLTTLNRFIQVDQVSITVATGTGMNAQITAFAYYLP